jgi:hypothetical protein
MSALTDARDALEAAKAIHQAAVADEVAAKATAAALRERLANGDTKIKPEELTAADAKVEHARLVAVGAERPLEALNARVREAQVDALCDSIVGTIPQLGSRVRMAIEALLDALDPLVASAKAYDEFVDASTRKVSITHHDLSSRVSFPRFGTPTIDHKPLQSCRGASQLAAVIAPAMDALGAPSQLVDGLKQMAAGAPALPTV